MSYRDVNIIESMYPTNIQNQALEGLERWRRRNMEGNVSIDDMVQNLIAALEEVNRHDVTEIIDGIIGSIISMVTTSVVDHGFEPRSYQTKDYRIGICCFFIKHESLRRKTKDWLVRNQDNVSEWGNISIHRLLFQ